MVQDELDHKAGTVPMDIDQCDDNDEEWKATGQTLVGKGPKGEDTLFLLQKRGNAFRVAPKG